MFRPPPLAQTGRNDRRCEFKALGLVAVLYGQSDATVIPVT